MLKQPDLPGVEGKGISGVRIDELDDAAEKYVKERNKRQEISPKEKAAKDALIELMLKHKDDLGVDDDGKIFYKYDDEVVIYQPGKPDVKVKTVTEVT